MKILFLTHRYPHPPNRGDRIRSFHLLEYMSERGEVTLVTFFDEPPSDESRQVLASLCQDVLAFSWPRWKKWWYAGCSFLFGKTVTEGLFYNRWLRAQLLSLMGEQDFDVIVVFCSSMFQYVKFLKKHARKINGNLEFPRVIVDLVDVDSQKWYDYAKVAKIPLKWLFKLEGRRLRQVETQIESESEAMMVVTQEEMALYRSFCPTKKIFPVTNGVDTVFFDREAPALRQTEGIPFRCVFVGAMDYRANVDGVLWFIKEVWPKVREKFPEAEFDVVGSNPVMNLVRVAAESPGVNVLGSVPDVRPYLKRAAVAVIPLRVARGIQNKVLESLSMGCAVTASAQSVEGIEAVSGEDLFICDSPEEWTEKISDLFKNENLRYKLGSHGRELVIRRYAWSACLENFGNLLVPKKDEKEP